MHSTALLLRTAALVLIALTLGACRLQIVVPQGGAVHGRPSGERTSSVSTQ